MFLPVHLCGETGSIINQVLNNPNEKTLQTTEGERYGGKNKGERENILKVLNKAIHENERNIELEEEQHTVAGRQKVTDKKGNYINGGL